MYYLLFLFYLIIGTYFVTRIPFIRKTGLSPKLIAILFVVKVLAGVAICWMSQKFYPGNDYYGLNTDGIVEYKILLNDPQEFFVNIFRSPYKNGYTGFFNSIGSYWNDLRYNIILKLLAFCDIFSQGNFYINSLIFNFFGFFGPVALFRVFTDIYKNKKWAVLAGCFLLPSTLYFSSGLHKDLIIFTMLGLFCYGLYFSTVHRPGKRRLLVIVLSFISILFIRNYVAVALVPASLSLIIAIKKRIKPLLAFAGTYAIGFLLIFTLQFFIPAFQPLKVITQKQLDFFDLPTAKTELETNKLEPTVSSFLRNLPQAFNHGFLRPYIWESGTSFLLPLSFELLVYEFLFLFMIFSHRFRINLQRPYILFSFFFAISMLLITGYIVPNMGSILRYKSIFLPFLLVPVLCSIKIKSLERTKH